jgi:uncharacterized protein YbcI
MDSMAGHHQQSVETIEARIANEMCEIQADYYGIAPRKAEAHYLPGRLVTVVLRETFTKAEQRLIEYGSGEPLREGRERFQRLSEDQFTSVIEQQTGERVATFVSTTHLEDAVAIEVFLLAGGGHGDRTNMETFEHSQESETGRSRNPEQESPEPLGGPDDDRPNRASQ